MLTGSFEDLGLTQDLKPKAIARHLGQGRIELKMIKGGLDDNPLNPSVTRGAGLNDDDLTVTETVEAAQGPFGNQDAKFIPDLMVSASIDDIVTHIASTRFSSGSFTATTFQNVTNINSTLIFCRASADEFNYSSNPTYTDSDNRIVVIDEGQEGRQQSFTFITAIGLYDANDNLLAVAKLSRPVEKNPEKDLTFRIRLDF